MGKRIITALFLLLPITIFAQTQTEQMTHIRQVFQNINQDSLLKKIVIDNEQLFELDKNQNAYDGGQEITGYYRRDSLVKIVNAVGLSMCKKTIEYYLEGGKVVFVYEKQDNFRYDEKKAEFNYSALSTAFEGRYYLANGKVIKTIESGALMGSKNEALKFMSNYVPMYSKMLWKIYKKK